MEKMCVKIPASPAGEYEILIGSGILDDSLISDFAGKKRVMIVSDENVERAGILKDINLSDGWEKFIISPAGEISKNITTVTSIIEQMETAAMGRDSVIVGIGGGTVGDMAGFAAAIFKRGIPVLHIPTTTVAQADSSIGGKTGVDSTKSKNAYGCFWQPSGVIIDVQTLKTLDERQYRSGLVESIKHALIMDSGYFEFFESNIGNLLMREDNTLITLAQYNCRIKASVVEQDPTEKNLRRILNYGHTIGHAVETLSDYTLYHGECVAVGIVGASMIEQKIGIGTAERTSRIKDVLLALSQPVEIPAEYELDAMIDIIRRDKKAVDGWPRFALIEEVGKAYCKDGQWAHPVNIDTVTEVIKELYG
ncbi:MAG: 3-dehydroquinate synthase [Sedimentisphaeraceae bacterium JB056]